MKRRVCDGCPQFHRVCDNSRNLNKKYCFYWYHGENRSSSYFQNDDLWSLIQDVYKEANSEGVIFRESFSIEEYFSKNYYILSFEDVEYDQKLKSYGSWVQGWIKVRDDKNKHNTAEGRNEPAI